MSTNEDALKYHSDLRGKLSLKVKSPIESREDLALAYTPGVAAPCREIHADTEKVWEYTSRGNSVAVISDGSAVLGLGNIGPEAALPVMEGKAALLKEMADIDAYPICLNTQDPDEIIRTVKNLEPTFGGINLEDIASPHCFRIEEQLERETTIPIFHDDQHGTAIVVLAGLINAMDIVGKNIKESSIVLAGAGAAGLGIAKMFISQGINNILILDSKGIVTTERTDLNEMKKGLASKTNPKGKSGTLSDALRGADAFIGVSRGGLLTKEMVGLMNDNAIVFALANPDPEILPAEAKAGGARIIATGRSDFPNQVNNLLAFPGVFRGALDAHATHITYDMKIAAALALAAYVETPTEDHILPEPLDKEVTKVVAKAVQKAALQN